MMGNQPSAFRVLFRFVDALEDDHDAARRLRLLLETLDAAFQAREAIVELADAARIVAELLHLCVILALRSRPAENG